MSSVNLLASNSGSCASPAGGMLAATEMIDFKYERACAQAVHKYLSKAKPCVQDAVDALQGVSVLEGAIPAFVLSGADMDAIPDFLLELAPIALDTRLQLMLRLARYVLDGFGFSRYSQTETSLSYNIPTVLNGIGSTQALFVATYVIKHGGLGFCFKRFPVSHRYLVLRAITDEHGCAILDMSGWTPEQVEALGDEPNYVYCDSTAKLIIKNCMWFPKVTVNREDLRWWDMTMSVMKVIATLPKLKSLVFQDCNLDMMRLHAPHKSRLVPCKEKTAAAERKKKKKKGDKKEDDKRTGDENEGDKPKKVGERKKVEKPGPFARLQNLEILFSAHNPRRNRPWGEMRLLLLWMLPMPSLTSLTLPPALRSTHSFSNQLGKMLASFSNLRHLRMDCPEKNKIVRPSTGRCEATEYGCQVQRLIKLQSLSMLNATPQAIVGWQGLQGLSQLELGVAPVQLPELSDCLSDKCTALEKLSLRVVTPIVKKMPTPEDGGRGKRRRVCGGTGTYLGPPTRVAPDMYGNLVPQCGWCRCCESYYSLVSQLTMLKALNTSVEAKGSGRCCKFHLDQLTRLSQLTELRFQATSPFVCNEEGRCSLPIVPSLQHLHLEVPVMLSTGGSEELLHLTALTYLSLTCSFGYGDRTLSELKQAISGLKKASPVLNLLTVLQLKDVRQRGTSTYGIDLPNIGTGSLATLLGHCTGLRSLYLPHSQGLGKDMDGVMKCVKKMTHLTALHNITAACDDCSAAGLKLPPYLRRLTLNCGGGGPSFVADELTSCTALTFLKLRIVEKMDPENLEILCTAIGDLTQLGELSWVGRYVANNCADMWDLSSHLLDVMGTVLEKLSTHGLLHTLHLYKFPLLKPGHGFANALVKVTSLEALSLKRCSISHAMYGSLGMALSRNPMNVKQLYLGRVIDSVVQPDRLSNLIRGFPHLFEVDYSLVYSGKPVIFRYNSDSGSGVFEVTDKKQIGVMMIKTVKRLLAKAGVHGYNAGRGTMLSLYTRDDEEPEDAFDDEIDRELQRRAYIDMGLETQRWLQGDELREACKAIREWDVRDCD